MKKPFTFTEFKSIYTRVPRLSVDAVMVTEDGLILVERALASYRGQWHLPGGTLHYKESVTDAIRRLVEDEVGLIIEPEELLGYIEYHSEEAERLWIHNRSCHGLPTGRRGVACQ